MADISITASLVLPSSSASITAGVAGATITQGQSLYLDTATNTYKLADADGTSPAFTFAGIALVAASAGQKVLLATADAAGFTIGATVLAGDVIYLSDTPGGLTKTIGDLESLDKIVVVGVMLTTTTMNLTPVIGGTLA